MRIPKVAFIVAIVVSHALSAAAQSKPNLTIDEFFNSVDVTALEISPDGNSVVIGTERADWDQQVFRSDLWLYRDDGKGSLIQLTQSGHDSDPKWSPDGRWIAFLSERKPSPEKDGDADSDTETNPPSQLYLISPNGGEAFPVTEEKKGSIHFPGRRIHKPSISRRASPGARRRKTPTRTSGKMSFSIAPPSAAIRSSRSTWPAP